jgi:hypothetical protein
MCDGCPMSRLDKDMDLLTTGAEMVSKLLAEIARTGEHKGVFDNPFVEHAAQEILKLRNRIHELERRMNAAEYSDLAGE